MELLLNYMYRGRATVDSKDIEDILDLAATLQVKGIGHLKGGNIENNGNDATEDSKAKKEENQFDLRRHRYKEYSKSDRDASLKLVQEGSLMMLYILKYH